MPYYELLCLANGKLKRAELASVLHKTCRAFMDNGGTVSRLVPLGADGNGPRQLAYKIRQNQVTHEHAFFVSVCAFSSPAAAKEVSRQLHIDERVLRHCLFRRPLMDSLRRMPDVGDIPPISPDADPSDSDYELQKFIQEFRRDFPDGFSADELIQRQQSLQNQQQAQLHGAADLPASSRKSGDTKDGDNDEDTVLQQEESVRDMLAQLTKGVSPPSSKSDSDLSWLSDIKKPDPPGHKSE